MSHIKPTPEEWRNIPGYEGLYEVSSYGRVRSLDRWVTNDRGQYLNPGRILRTATSSKSGSLSVVLSNTAGKSSKTIHQLVAMAFLNHTPTPHRLAIYHIDYDMSNNHVDNLKIITARRNSRNKRHLYNYTSQYRGVCWIPDRQKWKAAIQINGKPRYLGSFEFERDAHEAYQKALAEIKPHPGSQDIPDIPSTT